MSACPPHIFLRCASPDGRLTGFTGAVRSVRRNESIIVEPLALNAGAAAFLIARDRSFTGSRVSVKEPIEDQANRHL